jgi:hypothetical protein
MPDRLQGSSRARQPARQQPAPHPLVAGRLAPTYVRPGATALPGLAVGLLLGACSLGSEPGFSIFADPGKYQYYSCEQIAAELKTWSQKEQELKQLMDRADQGAGGSAVGLIAYKADYVAAGEEVEMLQATARDKKCPQAGTWQSNSAIR